MSRLLLSAVFLNFIFSSLGFQPLQALTYPEARREEEPYFYHGRQVEDPYRWMENLGSVELQNWVEAQNQLSTNYLKDLPFKSRIQTRMKELAAVPTYTLPFQVGGKYFYSYQLGTLKQRVICVADSIDELSEPKSIVFNPNELSKDGSIKLHAFYVSSSGQYMVCELAENGSDWNSFRILDLMTGKMLDDEVRWSKFSTIEWDKDCLGFYYIRYDEPKVEEAYLSVNGLPKLYYHSVGTRQSEDKLIYESGLEEAHMLSFDMTSEGRFLMLAVMPESGNYQVLYTDLEAEETLFHELDPWVIQTSYVANCGSLIYAYTTVEAPRGRLVAYDLSASSPSEWIEIIPENDDPLEMVYFLDDFILCHYLKHAKSVLELYNYNMQWVQSLNFGMLGSFQQLCYDASKKALYCAFNTFFNPYCIYRYDLTTRTNQLHESVKVDLDPNAFQQQQVIYSSFDGTPISMFVLHKKGLTLDGSHPTLLYGYGGFGISMTPFFSSHVALWLEMGGVYAIPHLRGGGEYGYQWHNGGMGKNKQRVFDDFLAASQWLVDQGYTRSDKLAIQGGSNGGLLVGACLIQAPDRFGCVIGQVGVYDMLRFHRFTIGWSWMSEYGNPDVENDFHTLYAYSPLHQVKQGTAYPATLLITGDHDDRVVPSHSFKFAAALQHAQAGHEPILLVTEKNAGHAGAQGHEWFEMESARLAFICQALKFTQPDLNMPRSALHMKKRERSLPMQIKHVKHGEQYRYL